MSRTHRRHDSPSIRAKRGPKPRKTDELKTTKQRRARERRSLRKEW